MMNLYKMRFILSLDSIVVRLRLDALEVPSKRKYIYDVCLLAAVGRARGTYK